MLPQASISTTNPARTLAARQLRTELVWDSIQAAMAGAGPLNVSAIARRAGLSQHVVLQRLLELRQLGEVRHGPDVDGVRGRTWMLGAEDFAARAESMAPTLTRAVQLGIFQRDPLVAALFGPTVPRCVSCEQPQGKPHAAGCVFSGANIDAAHSAKAANQANGGQQ
jgi:hypothetical protein